MKLYTDRKRIRAIVRAARYKATISIPYIRLKAAIGRFIAALRFSDNVTLSSIARLSFGRGITDSASATDTPAVVPNKGFDSIAGAADTLGAFQSSKLASDRIVLNEGTYFAEDYTSFDYTVDSVLLEVRKSREDLLGVSDTQRIVPGKGFPESVGVFDGILSKQFVAATSGVVTADIADIASTYLIRALTNTARIQEAPASDLGKPLADSYSVSDVSEWTLGLAPSDSSAVSDSAEVQSGKGISDTGTGADDAAAGVAKLFSDPLATEDASTLAYGATLSDSGTAVEDTVLGFSASISDSAVVAESILVSRLEFLFPVDTGTVADTATSTFQQVSVEVSSAADSTALNPQSGATDGGAAVDTEALSLSKGVSDAGSIADTIILSRLFARLFTDTGAAGDDNYVFDLQRAIADTGAVASDAAITFQRGAADSAAAADSIALKPNLGIVDTAAVSEGGSLRAQGYCSFDYFAEDYVGTSLTF